MQDPVSAFFDLADCRTAVAILGISIIALFPPLPGPVPALRRNVVAASGGIERTTVAAIRGNIAASRNVASHRSRIPAFDGRTADRTPFHTNQLLLFLALFPSLIRQNVMTAAAGNILPIHRPAIIFTS